LSQKERREPQPNQKNAEQKQKKHNQKLATQDRANKRQRKKRTEHELTFSSRCVCLFEAFCGCQLFWEIQFLIKTKCEKNQASAKQSPKRAL
jgi:hypothetical protein